MTPNKPFIIAIDGPAASGKGTLARKLASHYGFSYLDTGLTYRAVADELLKRHLPLNDEDIALKTASLIDFGSLERAHLSEHEIGEAASKVAVMGRLRKTLVDMQKAFAKQSKGAVLDGRDIGTVVCPDANVKLYIVAAPEVRAERRYNEMVGKGEKADYNAILADLKRRDERDMKRTESPLKPAKDAHLLDTTKLSIEGAFAAACAIIDPIIEKR
ncbi:(d)CMP kinase [Bartonella apis]|uniref:Cytidylate kinase n=1 Tax=Bartonella apis TaxID=1686310 RepID=A0A1R0FCH8_9HYPH|nr:(d)CMP kinase [Bartonella apis]MCT6824125.1 (d)CMP kinase [Bartonella apis]MCT6887652.1 (d)CMP kinase [Bartonella apis]OLY44588.1 cytidylate kinase [Bartonella apis]OLY48417.1 cytidylate kinase [Bartonella apis]